MLQRGSRARFAFEAPERRGVLDGLFRQKLDCYSAAQFDVFSTVNHTHAAATQDLQHAVMGNLLADQNCGCGRSLLRGTLGVSHLTYGRDKPIPAFRNRLYVISSWFALS